MSKINFFAKTNYRNQERIFGIKEDDRRRHMYVIGKTGMGKSNLLENMAIQDVQNDKGVCVVDPHGEFAEKIVKMIPSKRTNDLVYFNPADLEFPIAFNILESVEEDKKNLVASGMMGVFKKIWPDVWSSRMEYILNNTILALLDYPGSTMLGVNRMMSDSDFRKRVYPKIKDPVVKSFWLNEFDKWDDRFRKEAVAAIQNKVGQFLSSPIIRHIVGQPKSTIDMRKIMDKGKILIVNLSKGRIGEDAMHLLGGMVVTKLQLAAMGRVDIPEEERKDFYLYVDEFQNFATESFANILSEARKYRLSLILAHQYINQLIFDGNSTVKDAIFGNVGTIISFRVGADDAEYLEKEFDPIFLMNDIVNLPKYHIYLKLMIDGIAGDAFSAITLPPSDISSNKENENKAIQTSRERYGKSRKEIEEKIARWSGMFDFEKINRNENRIGLTRKTENKTDEVKTTNRIEKRNVFQNNGIVSEKIPESFSQNEKKIDNEKKNKSGETVNGRAEKPVAKNNQMFEAVCYTCEEKIFVPFRPDPNRPTFCKGCLKDYQRSKARLQNDKRQFQQLQQSKEKINSFSNADKGGNARDDQKTGTVSYTSQEKPLSLSQISHIAPKNFQKKPKVKIDLAGVRELINKNKNEK